jgi:hypothetical protein
MQLKHLNQIIGRALSACKGLTGAARSYMRSAIALLNRARTALRRGDVMGAEDRVFFALAFVRNAKAAR